MFCVLLGLALPLCAQNRTLELDGDGDYVELPSDLLTGLEEVTVEGWVNWGSFQRTSRFFDFGGGPFQFNVQNRNTTSTLWLETPEGNNRFSAVTVPDLLVTNEWIHVAAVRSTNGLQLIVNGVLMSTTTQTTTTDQAPDRANLLGRSNFRERYGDADFKGRMAEVRVWDHARTAAQIMTNLFSQLTGTEPGLVALYNFAEANAPGRDATGKGHDGKLMGDAKVVTAWLPVAASRAVSERVLELDGESNLETGLAIVHTSEDYTVECWALAPESARGSFRHLLAQDHQLYLGTNPKGNIRMGDAWNDTGVSYPFGGWHHLAVVKRSDATLLYIDGVPAAKHDGLLPSPSDVATFRIGRQRRRSDQDWTERWLGSVDEVRVWNVARSEADIRAAISSRLTGQEPGLAGYWNFEDPADPGRDLSPGAHHGTVVGNARVVATRRNGPNGLPVCFIVSGVVTERGGQPATNAVVVLSFAGSEVARVTTDANGNYSLRVRDAFEQAYDFTVSRGDGVTAERSGIPLKPGVNPKIDFEVAVPATLSGTVRDTSGQPLPAVMVQAVAAGGDGEAKVVAMALTGADGSFRMRHVPADTYRVRAQAPGQPAGTPPNSAGFIYSENGEAIELAPGAVIKKVALVLPPAPPRPDVVAGPNRILSLNGGGSGPGFVELPSDIFNSLDESTVEGWVKWAGREHPSFYSYGNRSSIIELKLEGTRPALALAYSGGQTLFTPNLIQNDTWCHVAWVTTARETLLYFNGVPVARDATATSFSTRDDGQHHFLGKSAQEPNGAGNMGGGLDEVRVWATARTAEQIGATMFQRLRGNEPGLAALWNFDDPQNPGRDATPHGFDGRLMAGASTVMESLPDDPRQLPLLLAVTGRVTDPDGRAAGQATVALRARGVADAFQAGPPVIIESVDLSGAFSILHRGDVADWYRIFTLQAKQGEFESEEVELDPSQSGGSMGLALRDVSSVSGQVLALNGRPLASVIVQARPQLDETATDYSGLLAEVFRLPRWSPTLLLRDSRTAVISRVDPQVDFDLRIDGIAGIDLGLNYQVQWSGILRVPREGRYTFHVAAKDFGYLAIDNQAVTRVFQSNPNHTQLEQTEQKGQVTLAAGDHALDLIFLSNGAAGQVKHPDGIRLSWSSDEIPKEVIPASAFSRRPPSTAIALSDENGVYRFPKLEPARYTVQALTPGGSQVRDGGGEVEVIRGQPVPGVNFHLRPFKKGNWQNYTTLDGLGNNDVSALFQAADGAMWFGTADGVSRFDGQQFTTLTSEQGLPEAWITGMAQTGDGAMWFATGSGLVRYEIGTSSESRKPKAEILRTFTAADGLANNKVTTLQLDSEKRLWVGTRSGLSVYDPAVAASRPTAFLHRGGMIPDLSPGGHQGAFQGEAKVVRTTRPSGPPPESTETVLELDGEGSYAELPADLFTELDTITVEGWVRWRNFRNQSRFFDFILRDEHRLVLLNVSTSAELEVEEFIGKDVYRTRLPDPAVLGEWIHLAIVRQPGGLEVYMNGTKVVTERHIAPPSENLDAQVEQFGRKNLLGSGNAKVVGRNDQDFEGQMDEVRVWRARRTEDQIRDGMHRKFSGAEPGLFALWNFDEAENGLIKDLGPGGFHGRLMGKAGSVAVPRPAGLPPQIAVEATEFNGTNNFVELPPNIFNGLTNATVEAWVKWERLGEPGWNRVFNYGTGGKDLSIGTRGKDGLWFVISDRGKLHEITIPGALRIGEWTHVAAVSGQQGMRLYLNGVLGGTNDFTGSFASLNSGELNRLGRTVSINPTDLPFKGQMDEVRVWSVARTEPQIRETMQIELKGDEPGLVGCWPMNQLDRPPHELNDVMDQIAEQPVYALFSDSTGAVWMGLSDGLMRYAKDASGSATNAITRIDTVNGLGFGAVSSIAEATDGTLWFGTYQGGLVSMKPAGTYGTNMWRRFDTEDGWLGTTVISLATASDGLVWVNTRGGGLFQFDGTAFIAYQPADGLAGPQVQSLLIDSNGAGDLWVGTAYGAQRLDITSVASYGTGDGLDAGSVIQIASTADNSVWCLTATMEMRQSGEAKLSRFDGRQLHKLSVSDGLAGGHPNTLYVDTDGSLLVGDWNAPIARYQPSQETGTRPRFEVVEGSSPVSALVRSSIGELWIGEDRGVKPLGAMEPSAAGKIGSIQMARLGVDGQMWFTGLGKGVYRTDGTNFVNFDTSAGLPAGVITAMQPLPDGSLLAIAGNRGVRLEGDRFVPWPANHARLKRSFLTDVAYDARGITWLGTSEGLYFTDGTAWTRVDERDGLAQNMVTRIHPAGDGTVWLGTKDKGLSRYRRTQRTPNSPSLHLTTDREYRDLAALPKITAGERVTFNVGVVDFRTVPAKRQYRWQFVEGRRTAAELKDGWETPGTENSRVETFKQAGFQTVAVQFIDRDLNYSPVTLATLQVVLPWHQNLAVMAPAGAVVLGLFGWALIARALVNRRKREAEQLREQMLEQEKSVRLALESKNAELEVARRAADEANRAKSTFLANMSHELRTPLNAIIGYSEMLQEESADVGQESFVPDLQKIHGAGQHLLGLINDVLDLSKIEAGKMTLFLEEFDLHKVLREVESTVQPLIRKNANTLVVECPEDIGTMHADQTKVRQILFNLLSNAAKFTEKGSIRLQVTRESVVRNQGSAAPAEPHASRITFHVQDTGIGMTAEQLGRLFEAFQQADVSTSRKFGGTGLGLAISRRFARLMGGELTAASQSGQGTTFTVELPAVVADPNKPADTTRVIASPTATASDGPVILVIDDDANVRELIHRSLTREGYRVELAADGKTGLELAARLQPRAITLDVMMPEMDGWTVLGRLKADPKTADLPVVMVTIVDDKNLGFSLGAVDYLTKPIDWHRLREVLGRYRGPGPAASVLVIEDDADTREMLTRNLEKEGWTVRHAANGRLGLLRMNEALPALILLDLMMPEMDGFEFMEEFRRHQAWRSIPVIVVTAKELTKEDHGRLNGSVARIIEKGTLTTRQLLAEIGNAMKEKTGK